MNRGDIVLAEVHFTNLGATKVRPAVVISSDAVNKGEDRVLVPISSRMLLSWPWHVVASRADAGFRITGLHRESVFLCAKLMTLHRSLIHRKLGTAAPYMRQIEAGVRAALAL